MAWWSVQDEAIAAQIMAALGKTPSVPEKALELGDPALLELYMAQAAARYGVPDDVIPKRQRGASTARAAEEERVTA